VIEDAEVLDASRSILRDLDVAIMSQRITVLLGPVAPASRPCCTR